MIVISNVDFNMKRLLTVSSLQVTMRVLQGAVKQYLMMVLPSVIYVERNLQGNMNVLDMSKLCMRK